MGTCHSGNVRSTSVDCRLDFCTGEDEKLHALRGMSQLIVFNAPERVQFLSFEFELRPFGGT